MVAEDEEKLENGDYSSYKDCQMQHLREKLYQLEKMLSRKEKCALEKTSEMKSEHEKAASHTLAISEAVNYKEPLREQIQNLEYDVAEDYIRQIADFEQKLLRDDKISDMDCYENARKKLSILELYRNLQMLEENGKYLKDKLGVNAPKLLKNKHESECGMKNHSCSGHFPCKKGKRQLVYGHTYNKNPKYDNLTTCSCDEFDHNSRLKGDTSKLNVSPEKGHRHALHNKTACCCHEISSSSDDSEESFYNCLHMSSSRCSHKDEDVVSESSSEDQTTCSQVSKCTCYCSKDYSHDESSDAEYDCDAYKSEKKKKQERFRGGLDVVCPKTKNIVKNDKSQKGKKDCPTAPNVSVDNFKLLKVEQLREGLERLKIRNRNLRDFLDTLQNPINLMAKPSEANTICTQVSSCYTFDVPRQTRSGLLTVVEVLKGKCRTKDAVIVALADELKAETDKKINVQDAETERILTEDKSLVWNGLIEEKDTGRKFTKKDSAIGFIVFLMILISHVKRSEMISYLSAAKKILTESPFKLGLFINDAESFSIEFLYNYYQNLGYSVRTIVKYSLDKWANILLQFNNWFVSYYAHYAEYLDVATDFFIAIQSRLLFGICAIFIGILLMNIKKIWVKALIAVKEFGQINDSVKSFVVKSVISIQRLLSSKLFWFTIGFYSQILWNFMQIDIYQVLASLNMYYSKEAEQSLFQHLNETEEITETDGFFDIFDYSWVASIFCNKFQSFVQFACYLVKNV